MSNEIVVVGSCNIDFFSYVPNLPKPGETVQGTKFATGFGGKGANQCVATAKLGGKTIFIARVGDDTWGTEYLTRLKNENIDTNYVRITQNETSGSAQIAVEDSGENNIIIVSGANGKLSANDIEDASEILQRGKVLVLQLESPHETARMALELCKGISIFNAAPAVANLDCYLLNKPTIFCVNETEASIITELPVNNINEAKEAVDNLLKRGCQSVLLTLGSEGALYASKENPKHLIVKPPKVQAVDTTGAGDAFIGAFAYMLANYDNLPMENIIEVACHLAAISVQKQGTQSSYPNSNDLKNVLRKLNIS